MSTFTAWRQRIGGQELRILVILILILAGTWGFVELADEVIEGETTAVDETLLLLLRSPDNPADPLGPLWLEELMRDLTALGSSGVLIVLTLSVVGYLLLQRQRGIALLVVSAVAGGFLLNLLLKESFSRPRPGLVPHGVAVYYTSFPSGHSMAAASTYLTLGALLARAQARRRLKAYSLGLAMVLTGLVGFSRVYLGVHWPTDVLAGWTAGALWALLCWLIAWWLQQRRTLRPSLAA